MKTLDLRGISGNDLTLDGNDLVVGRAFCEQQNGKMICKEQKGQRFST